MMDPPRLTIMFKDGSYYPLGCGEELSESEYQYQYELCANAGLDEAPAPGAPDGCWRVRGGALLKICDMSVAHLKNAINYFTRVGRGDHAKILKLREELTRRNT